MGQIKQMNYSCEKVGTVFKEFKANQEKSEDKQHFSESELYWIRVLLQ